MLLPIVGCLPAYNKIEKSFIHVFIKNVIMLFIYPYFSYHRPYLVFGYVVGLTEVMYIVAATQAVTLQQSYSFKVFPIKFFVV